MYNYEYITGEVFRKDRMKVISERHLDSSTYEVVFMEGRRKVKATSINIDDQNSVLTLCEHPGGYLSAYIEPLPEDPDD